MSSIGIGPTSRLSHMPQLDGLRAFAVAVVIAHHFIEGGWRSEKFCMLRQGNQIHYRSTRKDQPLESLDRKLNDDVLERAPSAEVILEVSCESQNLLDEKGCVLVDVSSGKEVATCRRLKDFVLGEGIHTWPMYS